MMECIFKKYSEIIKGREVPLVAILYFLDTSTAFIVLVHTAAPSPILFVLTGDFVGKFLPNSSMMRD